jgi:hypothetical protein
MKMCIAREKDEHRLTVHGLRTFVSSTGQWTPDTDK